MRKILPVLAGAITLIIGCQYLKHKKEALARDTSINHKTSFNNVFIDSARVADFTAEHTEFSEFTDQFQDFYRHRNYEYAWIDTNGLSEQAHNFMNLQNSYVTDYADSSLINPELMQRYNDILKESAGHFRMNEAALQLELHLTGQFFRYAAKVYRGSDLDVKELGWFIPRKKIDLTALLDSSLKTGISVADSTYNPLNRQYQQLQKALTEYIAREKKENKDTIPHTAQLLRKNHAYALIPAIKARLVSLGDLDGADSTTTYDSALYIGVRHFQQRMGLLEDGVIGNRVIEAMNVPIAERIRQILINLERIRWMPAEKNSNYILVNIPEYKMHVFDSARQAFDMNVIVGTAANSTVIFTGNLKYIVFSPYWNVPESIVRKEVIPGMQRDKNYINRNHMEITGYSGKIPIVRQKPGPFNSLGLVKFLFPNNYNIYFHDTPNRELFSQSSRSFSHGCIRLGEPKKLAAYLLRKDPTWNDRSIDSAMHLSKEKWVTLPKSIPVFIVYFTAWVDSDGILNFRKDIYGHDARMAEKLFRH